MNNLVSQDELLEAFGFSRPADLRRCLDKQRIPYFLGKAGKVTTTIQALNHPLIGTTIEGDNKEVEFV